MAGKMLDSRGLLLSSGQAMELFCTCGASSTVGFASPGKDEPTSRPTTWRCPVCGALWTVGNEVVLKRVRQRRGKKES